VYVVYGETMVMMMWEVDEGDMVSQFVPMGGDGMYSLPNGERRRRDTMGPSSGSMVRSGGNLSGNDGGDDTELSNCE
jgi:hypothetical protein